MSTAPSLSAGGSKVEGVSALYLKHAAAFLLLQQADRQVGLPLSAGEQRRAAALHKLAAVRSFAHQDCEPCCVIDGLFVGVPSSHPPGRLIMPAQGP